MPKIDESDLDVGNEPPFVARKVVIKRGENPKLDYSFADELGRGRFGTVVKCKEKKTGLELAAKFVSTKFKEERENVEREVDIMKSLQHRRLLQLYDVYDDGASEICIITELINGGELFERVIDDDFELTEKVCAIFMRQIIEGVQYMHDKYIMHLDMKPENILCVTRTGNRIKLIDFGLARRYDPNKTLQVMFGTPDFAAPEVLSYERVTPAADMWSVGVICYVLLSGLSPFMGNSDLETMTNVTKAIYDFDDESFDPISEEAKDFIAKLLIKDPKRRLTPNDCLNHKWLAKTPAKKGKAQQLSKTKLKKYVVRRRWQKAVTAIMALTRMGANLSLTGVGGGGGGQRSAVAPIGASSKSSTSSVINSTRQKVAVTPGGAIEKKKTATTKIITKTTISSNSSSSSNNKSPAALAPSQKSSLSSSSSLLSSSSQLSSSSSSSTTKRTSSSFARSNASPTSPPPSLTPASKTTTSTRTTSSLISRFNNPPTTRDAAIITGANRTSSSSASSASAASSIISRTTQSSTVSATRRKF